MTERASYCFTVKEFGDGTPWIMLEPLHDNLSILRRGFVGFDLPDGVSYEKAQEIARFLNDNLRNVSFTQL